MRLSFWFTQYTLSLFLNNLVCFYLLIEEYDFIGIEYLETNNREGIQNDIEQTPYQLLRPIQFIYRWIKESPHIEQRLEYNKNNQIKVTYYTYLNGLFRSLL